MKRLGGEIINRIRDMILSKGVDYRITKKPSEAYETVSSYFGRVELY